VDFQLARLFFKRRISLFIARIMLTQTLIKAVRDGLQYAFEVIDFTKMFHLFLINI
jgi:hypothetical protein